MTTQIQNPSLKPTAFTVSELNRQAKQLLEISFMQITVSGEISNFSQPSSGHWYFSLKDKKAQVRCAMFRNANLFVTTPPKNGDSVILTAKVSLYEGRGEFQLIVEKLELSGTGALLLAFEKLKKQLNQEGLFSEDRKQKIPAVPSRIGVITSPTGAALQDVLSVLKRRLSCTPVTIYPAIVQGQDAPDSIVKSIEIANQDQTCDVVIIARGGGSLEDLWAFNDEKVARAISKSNIPTISGVGHETDITICDFVADLRAPTPSVAAEKASPDSREWQKQLSSYHHRLHSAIYKSISSRQKTLDSLSTRLKHPSQKLESLAQRLDEAESRLIRLATRTIAQDQLRLENLTTRLQQAQPTLKIISLNEKLSLLNSRLNQSFQHSLTIKQQSFLRLSQLLDSVSPLATLSRGYSITMDSKGNILRDPKQVTTGTQLVTKLDKGEIISTVD